MKLVGTQEIRTPRLLLRRFTTDDAKEMYENWASDPRVTETLTWETHKNQDESLTILRHWVEQYADSSVFNWGIVFDGKLIGSISVVNLDLQNEHCEVGYCIQYDLWGKGIMTEALAHVLAYLFLEVGLHRVYLRHDVRNAASGRVMQKNGLTKEGVLRGQDKRKDGTWADMAVYAILRDDWIAEHVSIR